MDNILLIHSNNTPLKIENQIVFNPNSDYLIDRNIDYYISKEIIPKIEERSFRAIYIKDNLSEVSYLNFYGLTLAYHIRFEFSFKRFIPIVILSEIDSYLINKLTPLGAILSTKNIFLAKNSLEALDKYINLNIKSISEIEYQNKFLNRIKIEPPKDYLSHHDISNEWAIYRWGEFLGINNSKAIKKNREKISSMLYFKYLLTKNPIPKGLNIKFVPQIPKKSGKILYIDDEWNKGWSDIFKYYFSKNKNIVFETFEYNFKENNKFRTLLSIKKYCEHYYPDIVILDLRFTQSDYEITETEAITGIKITRIIKDINPAIQIIMLTATGKSTILENFYEHGILGYIKKEHPKDMDIDTKNNFKKLKELIDSGFEKSYLKEIWEIQNSILNLTSLSSKIQFEIKSIFEILDSNMEKRYIYALLSIHQCLEEINNLFIDDKRAIWIDTKEPIEGKTSTKNKILEVLHNRLNIYNLDNKIEELTHLRNSIIHPNSRDINLSKEQILSWFEIIGIILRKIDSVKSNG